MYTNPDGSSLNLKLYSGGSCRKSCKSDCTQNCKKYCIATKYDVDAQRERLSSLKTEVKEMQDKLSDMAKKVGGRTRKNRKRGGFFSSGNKKCEERCEKACHTNCDSLCDETAEEFIDHIGTIKTELAFLKKLVDTHETRIKNTYKPVYYRY